MAGEKKRRQYGLWSSPITAKSLAGGMRLSEVLWDQGGDLVWLEGRSGRGVLMVQPADRQAPRELNSELSVRGKLGYGGGDFAVGHGQVYFVEAKSGRIYRQPLASGLAQPVTPAFGGAAAPALSPDGEWLLFLRSYEGRDSLEIVDPTGEFWPQKLISGDDFYMQPSWHPDGKQVAWVAWDHPNMPWDGTSLRLGKLRFSSSRLPVMEDIVTIAGGDDVSVFQPEFSPDGRYLAYVSDAGGWWQLYLYDLVSGEMRQLTTVPAEHGLPAWLQGMRTYAWRPGGASGSNTIFFLRNQDSQVSLWTLAIESGEQERLPLDPEYTHLEQISAGPNGLAMVASGSRVPNRIITYIPPGFSSDELQEGAWVWRRSTSEELPLDAYAQAQAIEWKGMDGGTAYGLFYPPQSERFAGVGKPPLILNIHGGPTSQVVDDFNSRAQFFATRGYAVLEVNHRGSTGYGRDYRNMLRGSWGVYDVQDAVSGARSLAERGLVDGERLVIMGGSAGGFSVLKVLEDYPGAFKAGICLYAVSNQFSLAADTHKFEAHYSDSLLGPLPEAAEIYRERSPIFFVDKIQTPLALFQGEDDLVVAREQSDEVVESLQRRGIPHIYHVYPGEGHGFRKAETIEHYYQAVEKFLEQYVLYA